jgi:hypothetical protein
MTKVFQIVQKTGSGLALYISLKQKLDYEITGVRVNFKFLNSTLLDHSYYATTTATAPT